MQMFKYAKWFLLSLPLWVWACTEKERPRSLSELLALSAIGPSASARIPLQPQELMVSPKTLQLVVGAQSVLFSQIRESKGTSRVLQPTEVQYSSTNPSVAKVESSGTVIAMSPGKTAILAEFETFIASIPIVVNPDPDTPVFDPNNLKPTLSPGQLLASLEPTPLPTPEQPPLERIDSVKFTSETVGTGLKINVIFLNKSQQEVPWSWEENVPITYTAFSAQEWVLTAENSKGQLSRQRPYVIAEGEFDNLHELLKKGTIWLSCDLLLPNGKTLPFRKVAVTHIGGVPTPAAATPTPEAATPSPSP